MIDSAIYLTTAQKTWQDLTYCFCSSNVPRIFINLERHNLSHSDHMTVAACYTKLKGLWDELGSYNGTICSCGADHKRHRLIKFLMRLNESYSVIREQILLMNPLPDTINAYSSIAQEEKQRGLGGVHEMTETAATTVQKDEHAIINVFHLFKSRVIIHNCQKIFSTGKR